MVDARKFTTGAALGTVMGKVFGVRSQAFSSLLDRCPTFVSKDKSLKAKLLTGKTRKVVLFGFIDKSYCLSVNNGFGKDGFVQLYGNVKFHKVLNYLPVQNHHNYHLLSSQ